MRKIAIAMFLLLSCSVLYASKNNTVAVSDFTGKNLSAAETSNVSDFVRTALVKNKGLKVMDKSDMDIILAKQGFQQTGCAEADCAVKMGKILNVKKMVTGSVSKFDVNYFLNINLVEVKTGKILKSENGAALSMDELKNVSEELASKLFDDKAECGSSELIARVTYDFPGQVNETSGDSRLASNSSMNSGYSLGAEYITKISQKLDLGAGFEYQMNRELSNDTEYWFRYLPLYGTVRFHIFPKRDPYLKFNLGYNVDYEGSSAFTFQHAFDFIGGAYYAVGIGCNIWNKVSVEAMYSINNGEEHAASYQHVDDSYSRASIVIGYSFSLK